jgi:Uma2 family endonuclease
MATGLLGAHYSPGMRSLSRPGSVRLGLSPSGRDDIVPPVSAPRRRATYADLLEVPEHLVAEIIDGELITSPRPASPHALAASAIGAIVFDRFNGPPGSGAPGGWWILFEPELHFGEDVLVPDLAGWRRERMPAFPDVPAFELAPDWVCEVISPSTACIDRGRKLRVYARERVGHLWFVDPLARTLEIHRLESDHWALASTHEGAGALRIAPFDQIEVDTGRWWRD